MEGIPKTVHYCWFGKNKKPSIVEHCINSWRNNLEGYEIIEWNEDNFKVEDYDFSKKAYGDKKWAFVADYCRLWVLYNYGGIYLDTDMEVLRGLDDLLINNSFGGIEDYLINCSIWGCKKDDNFIGEVLTYYNNLDYEAYRGNLMKLAIPIHITEIANKYGYKLNYNNISYFLDNIAIYPKEYFYPKRHSWQKPLITENTYTVHHYEGSWRKPYQIIRSKIKANLLKFISRFRVGDL